jgi:Domain of unknown function (DUF1848)
VIISASYRTDIPAFYGDWFLRRIAAGGCRTVNPYNGRLSDIPLTRDRVDGIVFWTRNAAPFLAGLEQLAAVGYPFAVHYTLTGYPRPLERSVAPLEASIETMRLIARRYGPRALVWRYDPVMLTSLTPPRWHRETFARLARDLAGSTDEVVLSFVQVYAKTRMNSDRAAEHFGFTWWDPALEEKRALLHDLGEIARDAGLAASLCAQPELLGPGMTDARCIDAQRLSDLAGRAIVAETKGNRPGCRCARAQDVGAYDTCPHGCVYCYAVRRPETAKRRYRVHDPDRATLAPPGRTSAAEGPGAAGAKHDRRMGA